jgi:two-component system sensor histidine kinase VicK
MADSVIVTQHEEAARLKALLEYEILDTPPDPALNEILRLATAIAGAHYAFIGFVDSTRVWFKAQFGFTEPELPRFVTPCNFAIMGTRPMLLADAGEDPRFSSEGIALTSSIFCRSYLGVPLVAPAGEVLGTLAVLAPSANAFTPEHAESLEILARQIVTRLEFYSGNRLQERTAHARRRTDRALSVERNFVSAVLDTISALVLVLDPAGRIVRVNRACEQLSGYTFAELSGSIFAGELFLPEDRDLARRLVEQAKAGDLHDPWEVNWTTRNGIRRIAWTATTLDDDAAEAGPAHASGADFLILTGVDITAQHETELALRTSETRYRLLIEGSLGMVCTHDLDGRLLSINTHAAENLGYRPEEMIGGHVYDLMLDEYRPGWQLYMEALHDHGEDQGVLTLRRRHGGLCFIAYRNRLIRLPGTEPFVLGHGIDITEKTEAENNLHALMRQRESILDSVGDGIYGTDMEGRTVFINQAAASLLGYTQEELIGRDIHSTIHHSRSDGSPYPADECPVHIARLRHPVPTRVRDEVFWHREGHPIPVEYVACPLISEDGSIGGIVVAFQDVTERRRLDRMKDEFISTVSHELRTPLTSLRAALGLIASGTLNSRPEKSAQMLDIAIGNCDRLARLVNDILDFERISSGQLHMDFASVYAPDLLHRAAALQASNAQKAGVTLRIEAASVTLWADADRLLQTLENLIGNAIKFSPPGGEILLKAGVHDKDEALIEICDQGRGIPPEKLSMIFERFQQVDASDSRIGGGTGLGLAICRSIVEQHQGRIWVESAVGKGSTFFLTLPMKPGTSDPEAGKGSGSIASGGST